MRPSICKILFSYIGFHKPHSFVRCEEGKENVILALQVKTLIQRGAVLGHGLKCQTPGFCLIPSRWESHFFFT